MEFVPLSDHATLPFDNNSFDCVIGSGVLEHVAMDYESLKEIYRILKPDGRLIITFLPNKFSYAEFMVRNFGKYFGKSGHNPALYKIENFIDAEIHWISSSEDSTPSSLAVQWSQINYSNADSI